MKQIKPAWNWLVNFFEHGDLVPLLVLVSAVHYAAVLRGRDEPLVAVAIGLLVDLGHYRTVRAAVRYSGDWRQSLARWTIAAGMTALSLNYHQRFYQDWWLSVPLPLLIASLAWLQYVDRGLGVRGKPGAEGSKPASEKGKATQEATEAKTEATPEKGKATQEALACPHCSYKAASPQAYWGHMAKHKGRKAKAKALVLEAAGYNGNGKAK